MSFPFHIDEHAIDAQYIRDSARAKATPNAPLKLCIKKYWPIDNPNPQPGDVTVVTTDGIGFPKVCPRLPTQYSASPRPGSVRAAMGRPTSSVKARWLPHSRNLDSPSVSQGTSGILNEQQLGNDSQCRVDPTPRKPKYKTNKV
jgi:hypothetical protein